MKTASRDSRRASFIAFAAATAIALVAVSATLAGVRERGTNSPAPGVRALPQPINGNVTLTRRDVALLSDVKAANPGFVAGEVQLLRTSGAISFYRILNTAGSGCFGLGGLAAAQILGAVACPSGFPSTTTPVVDFTVMHGQPGADGTRVWSSAGFTADDIATVAFTASDGTIVSRTPVVDDLYEVTDIPTVRVTSIVGLDAAGNTVWSKPLS